ncbi:hypothetical protein E0Z10_g8795 [Xylaria hypoxylon]|uniref:Uncharacterized protein n=1 Tax=Xylaria hypoxylon TaxID=37992 RepID=A0A4Z0YL17_9PEZI|nr:hypothetical protein E0Z10_g8795 [Xylaria hypoxylon]
MSQETHQENEKMKAAIADIVRAARCPNDRPTLLRAVRAAADVAGVDASGLLVENPEEDAVEMGDRDAVISTSTQTKKHDGPPSTTRIRQGGSKFPGIQTRGYALRPSFAGTTSQPSGQFSPRLDYGMWVDARRVVTIFEPPIGIIPFLGAGRYTFSGQLYWVCIEYLISLCRVVTTPHSPALWFTCQQGGRLSPGEAETRLWTVLQHSPPVISVQMAQALAEAHREFRDHGYMNGDSQSGPLLRRQVEVACVDRRDLSVWMTITELEKHVRRQLGAEAFSRLESAIAASCTASPSKAVDEDVRAVDEDVRTVVRLLMKNLAESYTCFGDGPRWRVDAISALFSEKMGCV